MEEMLRAPVAAATRDPRKSVLDSNGSENKATRPATQAVDEIVVGKRHRRDLGDIAELAANMGELGLLQPIVIRPDRDCHGDETPDEGMPDIPAFLRRAAP